MAHIIHPIAPVFDKSSELLILGSFPSVKSRQTSFFYGHPQNRFWAVLSSLFAEPLPDSVEEKTALLLRHNIALWDVIYACDITGSSDASIRGAVPTDLSPIVSGSNIKLIFCNGSAAWRLYRKFQYPLLGREAVRLPSTSPANAKWRLDDLVFAWSVIK